MDLRAFLLQIDHIPLQLVHLESAKMVGDETGFHVLGKATGEDRPAGGVSQLKEEMVSQKELIDGHSLRKRRRERSRGGGEIPARRKGKKEVARTVSISGLEAPMATSPLNWLV